MVGGRPRKTRTVVRRMIGGRDGGGLGEEDLGGEVGGEVGGD